MPGKLEGVYKVETYDDANNEVFQGSLDIKPVEVSYSLTWTGTPAPANGSQMTVKGVGLIESNDLLAACFQ